MQGRLITIYSSGVKGGTKTKYEAEMASNAVVPNLPITQSD